MSLFFERFVSISKIDVRFLAGEDERIDRGPMLAPRTPAFVPVDLSRCVRCGESTSAGYWFIDGRPLHTRCVRWEKRPFPFVWAVDLSRSLIRKAPDDLALRDAARLVWALGRRWPHDAARLLDSACPAVAVILASERRLRR